MKRRLIVLVLAGALLSTGCRQEQPVSTVPTPTPTPTPSPTSTPLQDFVLEGEVQEIWTAGSATTQAVSSPSPGRSPASSPTTGSTPGTTASPSGTGSPGASPGSVDAQASGAIAVELTSYFSDRGCVFKAGDLVVVRITPQTTFEPSELGTDEEFPENLEDVRVTVAGVLLEPGQNCLPVAESITLLEGAAATASPRPTASPSRPRARSRPVNRTPSPTPSRAGPAGSGADPGASNTGAAATGSNLNNEDDRRLPVDDTGTDEEESPGPDEESPGPDEESPGPDEETPDPDEE